MRNILIFCFIGVAIAAESDLKELDAKVFTSLDKTKLKFLQGTYSQDDIVMHYTLTRNRIEKVAASHGTFKLVGGQLQANLINKRGVLTGIFHTVIRRKTVRKTLKLPIFAVGSYVGKMNNATLSIAVDLPRSPGAKMKLRSCHANIMHLELELNAYNRDDNESLKELKYWLRDAMQPGFSELFCDSMRRVLIQGMRSPVVRALMNRTCQLLGPDKCPPRPPSSVKKAN